jgi:hypothetical protein
MIPLGHLSRVSLFSLLKETQIEAAASSVEFHATCPLDGVDAYNLDSLIVCLVMAPTPIY